MVAEKRRMFTTAVRRINGGHWRQMSDDVNFQMKQFYRDGVMFVSTNERKKTT